MEHSIIESILVPLFSILIFIILAGVIGWFIGGPQMCFQFMGFFLKLFMGAMKIVIMVVSFFGRRFLFLSKEYVQDDQNKSTVWNIAAGIIALLCLWYLVGTAEAIYRVYTWRDDGWLVLGFLGLAAIRGSYVISNAPFMKMTKFTKEWGSVLADGLCGLTFASAIVHLELYYVHEKFPKFSFIAAMCIYLAYLAYMVVKLTEGSNDSVLGKYETAVTKAGEGDTDYTPREKADLLLAYTDPTMAKPKSEPMIIPEVSRYQHMQIIGPTGTGKSILFSNLAVQDIIDPKVGVIALEPTKDFTGGLRSICKKTSRKYHSIDPTDPNTAVINPLDGDDVDEICEINTAAFIGYVGERAPEFYKNKQKNALRMAIKVAKYIKKDDATYIDLLDILRPTNGKLRDEYLKRIADEEIRADLDEYNVEFSDPKMFNNALQNYSGLIDYLKELTSNKYMKRVLCAKSTVSLRQVFDKGEVLLVTTAYGKLKQLGFVLGRLMITMLQSETFARTEVKDELREKLPPISVYIDEVQNYVSEPFAEIFEMARKAKMMMHIAHQGLAQLRKISERLEQTIFDNARQKVVFGGININDCDMFAEKVGQYWKNITTTSAAVFNPFQVNQMKREELRLRMLPSEIHKLPGFNTKTFEPAKVLCLLVIHNVIMDEQIGLVGPLPKHIFRDTETIMEMATGNITNNDESPNNNEVPTPSDESGNINYTEEQQGMNEGEGFQEFADEAAASVEQDQKSRNRRRTGNKSKKQENPAVRDEDTLVLNDMHAIQDQQSHDNHKLTEDEQLLLLMHDDDLK